MRAPGFGQPRGTLLGSFTGAARSAREETAFGSSESGMAGVDRRRPTSLRTSAFTICVWMSTPRGAPMQPDAITTLRRRWTMAAAISRHATDARTWGLQFDLAAIDDGSCEFESCAGCTDIEACNYDPAATIEDGSCATECNECPADLDEDGFVSVSDV